MDKPQLTVTGFLSAFHDAALWFAEHETDLLIELDELGRICLIYPGFTNALGYTEADIYGTPTPIADLLNEQDTSKFIKSFGWYNLPGPPFRLLKKGGGDVAVRMMRYEPVERRHMRLILRLV